MAYEPVKDAASSPAEVNSTGSVVPDHLEDTVSALRAGDRHPSAHPAPQLVSREDEENKIGAVQAFFATLKAFIGAGLTGLPYAFRSAGLFGGLICLVSCIFLIERGVRYVVKSKQFLCSIIREREGASDAVELSYPDLAFALGGPIVHKAISASLIIAQLGVGVAYQIFISQSISSWLDEIVTPQPFTYSLCVLGISPLLLVMVLLPSVKKLVPLATVACVLLLLAVLFILLVGFYENCTPGHSSCGHWHAMQLDTLPIAFGIMSFALEGIFPVLPIEHCLRQPGTYQKILSYVFSVIFVACLSFGVTGYYIFGDKTADVITLNIQGPVGLVIKLIISTVLFLSYPLQLFPLVVHIDEILIAREGDTDTERLHEKFVRVGCVALTAVIAIILPHFGNVLSLVGCLCMTTAGMIVPAYLHYKTFPLDETPVVDRAAMVVLVVAGFSIMISGFYANTIQVLAMV